MGICLFSLKKWKQAQAKGEQTLTTQTTQLCKVSNFSFEKSLDGISSLIKSLLKSKHLNKLVDILKNRLDNFHVQTI